MALTWLCLYSPGLLSTLIEFFVLGWDLFLFREQDDRARFQTRVRRARHEYRPPPLNPSLRLELSTYHPASGSIRKGVAVRGLKMFLKCKDCCQDLNQCISFKRHSPVPKDSINLLSCFVDKPFVLFVCGCHVRPPRIQRRDSPGWLVSRTGRSRHLKGKR